MAHKYKGRSVPDCFINPEGEVLAMWEDGHQQCQKCSVEAMCQEAQFELESGAMYDDYGFKDDFEIAKKPVKITPTVLSAPQKPPAQNVAAIVPKGPRMNELQLAVPRSRQVLPYAGETLWERLGKNVILGSVTSSAFEAMLTFGAFEWKPEPVKPEPAPEENKEAKEALNLLKNYLTKREEEDRRQREDIAALRKIIEGK